MGKGRKREKIYKILHLGKACPHYGPPKRNVRLLTKDGASGAPKTIVLWPIGPSLMHKQAWVGSTRNKYQISIPLFAHVFCAARWLLCVLIMGHRGG